MPTQPSKRLLRRELLKTSDKDLIESASRLLKKMIDYADDAFKRCEASATGNTDEHLSVFALYLHIIEITEAIEILISEYSLAPTQLLLRSSFEGFLSMEYILEDDLKYVQRSLSWLVCYIHPRSDVYESLDPSVSKKGSLRQALKNHKEEAVRRITPPNATKKLENINTFLSKSRIRPIEEEYQKCKRSPRWYSLFNGPKSFRELAKHLKRDADYLILYKHWSVITHAQDLSRFITGTPNSKKLLNSLGEPEKISTITRLATIFLFDATRQILLKFRPEEDLQSLRSLIKNYYSELLRHKSRFK